MNLLYGFGRFKVLVRMALSYAPIHCYINALRVSQHGRSRRKHAGASM
jgi:hypothetical protein